MQAMTWTRAIGWASLGLTLASVVAPDALGKAFGLGERRKLIRALGARDLIVGSGLAFARNPAPWLRARFVSEVFDAVFHGGGALADVFNSRRALPIAAGAAAVAILDYVLLRKLQHR